MQTFARSQRITIAATGLLATQFGDDPNRIAITISAETFGRCILQVGGVDIAYFSNVPVTYDVMHYKEALMGPIVINTPSGSFTTVLISCISKVPGS